jgi:hypothetical protein
MLNLYGYIVNYREKLQDMKNSNKKLKYSLIAIGVVVVIFLLLIIVKAPTTPNTNASDALAPQSLVDKITSIPQKIFDEVGAGTSSNPPKPINGTPISVNGKPQIVYMGAEYCPYCATERWAMISALSRFGTFSNLGTTHSSSTDVFPSTQTLSFHGSSYSSPYLVFSPTEIYTNIPAGSGSGYTPLDKPTAQEQNLQNTYDAPPYVSSSNAGAIPFIYFAGKYVIVGATYSPQVLQGKTADQIATAMNNPSTDIAKGAIGAANSITAAICGITNNQPSNVCNTTMIRNIQATINK